MPVKASSFTYGPSIHGEKPMSTMASAAQNMGEKLVELSPGNYTCCGLKAGPRGPPEAWLRYRRDRTGHDLALTGIREI